MVDTSQDLEQNRFSPFSSDNGIDPSLIPQQGGYTDSQDDQSQQLLQKKKDQPQNQFIPSGPPIVTPSVTQQQPDAQSGFTPQLTVSSSSPPQPATQPLQAPLSPDEYQARLDKIMGVNQSSTAAEVGKSALRGLATIPEKVGGTMQYAQTATNAAGLQNPVTDTIGEWGKTAKDYYQQAKGESPSSPGVGAIAKNQDWAAEHPKTDVAMGLAEGIAPFLVPGIGQALPFAYGGSEAQESYEKLKKNNPGMSDQEAAAKAAPMGLAEGMALHYIPKAGELLGGVLSKSLSKVAPEAAEALSNTFTPTVTQQVTKAVPRWLADTVMFTAQGVGMQALEKGLNVDPNANPISALSPKEIASNALLSLVFTAKGGWDNAKHLGAINEALSNPEVSPDLRTQAVGEVYKSLSPKYPDAAQNFADNARVAINGMAGQPPEAIPLDSSFLQHPSTVWSGVSSLDVGPLSKATGDIGNAPAPYTSQQPTAVEPTESDATKAPQAGQSVSLEKIDDNIKSEADVNGFTGSETGVLNYLRRTGELPSGRDPERVQQAVSALMDKGFVTQGEDGRYAPIPLGEKPTISETEPKVAESAAGIKPEVQDQLQQEQANGKGTEEKGQGRRQGLLEEGKSTPLVSTEDAEPASKEAPAIEQTDKKPLTSEVNESNTVHKEQTDVPSVQTAPETVPEKAVSVEQKKEVPTVKENLPVQPEEKTNLTPAEQNTLDYLKRDSGPIRPNDKNRPIYDSLTEKGLIDHDTERDVYTAKKEELNNTPNASVEKPASAPLGVTPVVEKPTVESKGAAKVARDEAWKNSDLATHPNISIDRVNAEKQPEGGYKLLYTGTKNEVFVGERFRSPGEARQFFKAQQEKAKGNAPEVAADKPHYTTEQQQLMASIAEGKTLFKGELTDGKRSMIERSVKNAQEKLDALNNAESRKTGEKSAPVQSRIEPEQNIKQGDVKKSKIEDFGEKIGGSAKDTWGTFKDKIEKNNVEHIKTEPLSKVWPEPNYKKMIDEGKSKDTVNILRSVRDDVPDKPRKSWKVARWADDVKTMMDLTKSIMDKDISIDQLLKSAHELPAGDMIRGIYDRVKLYEELGHDHSLRGIDVKHADWTEYNSKTKESKKISAWVVERKDPSKPIGSWPQQLGRGETRQQAIDDFKNHLDRLDTPPKNKADAMKQFMVYQYRDPNKPGWNIGVKRGRNYIDLAKFDTAEEARKYRNANVDDLVKKLKVATTIPSSRVAENRVRVGEQHREGDVTTQQFKDEFGFRGGEFGNYVNNSQRQDSLNRAYDALQDLSTILNIPPRALSLNGELALGFGSRGKGGIDAPAAHYERDKVVINLTRDNGPGSLAHEWFHALDNYLSRSRGADNQYITDHSYRLSPDQDKTRQELIDAIKNVKDAISDTGLSERSKELDEVKGKKYWSQNIEMNARAFENYILDKMEGYQASNDYLVNINSLKGYEDSLLEGMANGKKATDIYPYLLEKEVKPVSKAFDKLFDTIKSKETDKGTALYSSTTTAADLGTTLAELKPGQQKVAQALVDKGKLTVLTNQDEARKVIDSYDGSEKPEVKYASDGKIAGFYVDGHSYLVNDGMEKGRAWDYIQHEVGTHAGKLLHDEPGFQRILDTLERRKDEQTPSGDAIRAAYDAVPKDTNPEHVREEALAYLVQNAPEVSLARRAITMIKRMLVKLGITDHSIYNEKDFAALADMAIRREASKSSDISSQVEQINQFSQSAKMSLGRAKRVIQNLPAFKEWFGDSKVVGENGAPLVVYHGTSSVFHSFDMELSGKVTKHSTAGMGIFFTKDPAIASAFSGEKWDGWPLKVGYKNNANVIASYLSIKNPVRMTAAEFVRDYIRSGGKENVAKFVKDSKAKGHDGVIIKGDEKYKDVMSADEYGDDSYVAFNPTQIKSIFNSTWSPHNPDIMFSASSPFSNVTDAMLKTPAFKRWFGDSKAVDEKGNPLTVYHGSPTFGQGDNYTMDPNRASGKTTSPGRGLGTFFTENPREANGYAGPSGQVTPLRLRVEHPLELNSWELPRFNSVEEAQAFRKRKELQGYDGIHIKDEDHWVTFDANQEKHATENTGEFSRTNNDVRFARSRDEGAVKDDGGEDFDTLAKKAGKAPVDENAPAQKVAVGKYPQEEPTHPEDKHYRGAMQDAGKIVSRQEEKSLKNETNSGKKTEFKYPEKSDSSIFHRIFSTPEWYFGKKSGAAGRVLEHRMDQSKVRKQKEDELFTGENGERWDKVAPEFAKEHPKEYEGIRDYIVNVGATGEGFGLIDHGGEDVDKYGIHDEKGNEIIGEDKKPLEFDNRKDAVKAMIAHEVDHVKDIGYSDKQADWLRMAREATERELEMRIQEVRDADKRGKEAGASPFAGIGDTENKYGIFDSKGNEIGRYKTQEEASDALKNAAQALSYMVYGKRMRGKKEIDIKKSFANQLAADHYAERIQGRVEEKNKFGKLELRPLTEKETRGKTLHEMISQMNDLSGTYFPRHRPDGEYILKAYKDGVDPIREHFDIPAGDKETSGKVGGFLKGMANKVTPMGRRITELEKQGYKTTVEKSSKITEDVFGARKLAESMDALLSQTFEGRPGQTEAQLKESAAANQALMRQLADIFKSRGFLSSSMHRVSQHWEGYETDANKAIAMSLRNTAAGIAKRTTAEKMLQALMGRDFTWEQYKQEVPNAKYEDWQDLVNERRVDPATQKNLYKDVTGFIDESLRNPMHADRIIGTMRGLATVKYLGFRVSSATSHPTQMFITVPPVLSHYADVSLGKAFRLIGSSAKSYLDFRRGIYQSPEDKFVHDYIQRQGWDAAQFNREAAGILQSKLSGAYSKFAEASMAMFGAMDRINRAVTIHAAFKALKKGETYELNDAAMEEIMKQARTISDKSHFVYDKAVAPAWTYGEGNVLRALYTFKKFDHSYMLSAIEMGFNHKDYKNMAWLILSPAILAGAGASAAIKLTTTAMKAFGIGGDDPEEGLYKWASKTFGSDQFVRQGLFGLANIDMRGSLAMKAEFPTTIKDLLGAPAAVLGDEWEAAKFAAKVDINKAVEKALPTGLGAPLKAAREYNEGITTNNDRQTHYGNMPLKGTAMDAVVRALSYNPARLSGIREMQWDEKKVAEKYATLRKDINQEYVKNFVLAPDKRTPEKVGDLVGMVQAYNQRVRQSGRPDIPYITQNSIQTSIRMASRPSKLERMRQAQLNQGASD